MFFIKKLIKFCYLSLFYTINFIKCIRFEPFYHKLQYSKVTKSDVAAAIFGIILSIVIGYLALGTLGSSNIDLSDLLVLFWYIFIFYKIYLFWLFNIRFSYSYIFFFQYLFFFFKFL